LPARKLVTKRSPGSRRATVRDALDAALRGASLNGRDRQFLSKLVHWDKRNAAAAASLLWKARAAGRAEALLTARQLEIVVTALEDAAVYRNSGADARGCVIARAAAWRLATCS
jgi:hypothetical protein